MCVNKLAEGAAIGKFDNFNNYNAISLLGILIPIDPVLALNNDVVSSIVDLNR